MNTGSLKGVVTEKDPDVPELTLLNLTVELRKLTKPIEFGLRLGVPEHNLEIIKMDHRLDISGQKMGVFRHISSNYKSLGITWDKVAEALDFVNDNDLAKDIRKKYCREVVGTDQRINEIAENVGIDLKVLDKQCAEHHLLPISKLLEHWPSYGDHLGLSPQEVAAIQQNVHLTAFHMKPLEMLTKWLDKCAYSEKGTYRHLLRGCLEIHGSAKLVGDICKVLK